MRGGSGSAASRSATAKPSRSGKLDVQQHDLRPQAVDSCERVDTARDRGDDVESLRLEQGGRGFAKAVVVVDDEHARAHAAMVAEVARERIVASRSRALPDSRATTG